MCANARPDPLSHNGTDYHYYSTVLTFGQSPIGSWTTPSDEYFVSWNTACDGSGTTYQPNASLTSITSDIDLYPIFSPNPTYTISVFFDTNEVNGEQISAS